MFNLVIKNLNKIYKVNDAENFRVLKNINLSFSNAGLVTILGKSGSGKSTLLNIIGNIDKEYDGEVLFNEQNIRSKKISRNYLNNKCSIVFQNYCLIDDLSIIDNIAISSQIVGKKRKNSKDSAIKLLNYVGISSEKFKQKTSTLSAGEKQRVAIARSLINNPEVLLCDEPTGALDKNNSEIVMSLLKEISKNQLVIIVTHNLQLTYKYSDRIIKIDEGEIIEDKIINNVIAYSERENYKYKKYNSWTNIIAVSNFKKRFFRNLFSALGFAIGISALCLTLGFINGKNTTAKSSTFKQFDYGVGTIAKEDRISTGSLLTLTKSVRPDYTDLINNQKISENFIIGMNFDELLPQNVSISYGGVELDDCLFNPVYKFDNKHCNENLIIDGNIPLDDSINEVIINLETYNYLSSIFKTNPLNKTLHIKQIYTSTFYDIDNTEITDDFIFEKDLVISAICTEINYLPSRKIFYSYLSLENYLKEENLLNLSTYFNKDISWYDRIFEADNSSKLSSYSFRLFPLDLKDINLISNDFFENTSYGFTSPSLLISTSLNSFLDVAEYGLIIFLIISIIGVILILGIISYTNYSDDHKKSAILTCLGAKNNQIIDTYCFESIITGFIGLLISIPITFIIEKIGNQIIKSFYDINGLIQVPFTNLFGIKFLLPLLIFIITILICCFSSTIPINFSKKISLKEELKSL